MTLRERIERHAYGPCDAWERDHTHCPTCGSVSLLHNRAACTGGLPADAPVWVQRARTGQLPPKVLR